MSNQFDVSPFLFKYLRILQKSKKMEKELELFSQLNEGEISKYDYEAFLDRFFIPKTSENTALAMSFLLNQGQTPGPYTVQECRIASKKRPINISVDCPSIVISVFGHLTGKQWEDVKKQYEKHVADLKKRGINLATFEDFKTESDGDRFRGFDDIDLKLEIYTRLKGCNKGPSDLKRELPDIFKAIGEPRRSGFDEDLISSHFNDLNNLIKRL